MALTLNISKTELISKLKEELKHLGIKPPEWAQFVKTGAGRDRQPSQEDWWHIRAASVLVAVWGMGPVGVNKLRRKYGSNKNRGMKPERFYKGSGNIIRKIFQQLEAEGLTKKGEAGRHKGRVITKKGIELISRLMPKASTKKEEPAETKKEEKKPELKKEEKKAKK